MEEKDNLYFSFIYEKNIGPKKSISIKFTKVRSLRILNLIIFRPFFIQSPGDSGLQESHIGIFRPFKGKDFRLVVFD